MIPVVMVLLHDMVKMVSSYPSFQSGIWSKLDGKISDDCWTYSRPDWDGKTVRYDTLASDRWCELTNW